MNLINAMGSDYDTALINTYLNRIKEASDNFYGEYFTILPRTADYVGDVELKEFKHIKSYNLPDNLKDLMKKPILGEYAD